VTPWEALVAKSWPDIEAIEQRGRLLFSASIRTKGLGGKVTEVPVKVRVLRKPEVRQALQDAEKWAKELGIDPNLPRYEDTWKEIEDICILARSVRDASEPYDQHMLPQELEARYEGRSLEEIKAKVKLFADLTDPRDPIADENQFWALVGAIVKKRAIDPLAAIESLDQNNCIVRMAELSLTSPAFSAWYTQFASSTPEPSPSTT